jgi:hypothetical protein
VFHEQARQEGASGGGPLGRSGPRVCARSEAGTIIGTEHKAISMGVVVGTEHEASMGGQQARSTRQSGARSCIHGRAVGAEHEAKRSTKLHHGRPEGIIFENRRAKGAGVQLNTVSGRPGASLSPQRINPRMEPYKRIK